jgi:phage shock protein B
MKTSKGLTPEDEKMLTDVWESTKKMEDRIQTLERILDIESPSWRQRHE